jgi:hypothetical protein
MEEYKDSEANTCDQVNEFSGSILFFLLPLASNWGLAPILEHRADFSIS